MPPLSRVLPDGAPAPRRDRGALAPTVSHLSVATHALGSPVPDLALLVREGAKERPAISKGGNDARADASHTGCRGCVRQVLRIGAAVKRIMRPTEFELLVLSEVVHVEVSVGLHPVFVGFGGARTRRRYDGRGSGRRARPLLRHFGQGKVRLGARQSTSEGKPPPIRARFSLFRCSHQPFLSVLRGLCAALSPSRAASWVLTRYLLPSPICCPAAVRPHPCAPLREDPVGHGPLPSAPAATSDPALTADQTDSPAAMARGGTRHPIGTQKEHYPINQVLSIA